MKHELLVATTNRGKLGEFRALLVGLDVDVRGLSEVLATPIVVEEDGDSFEANATKKAVTLAGLTGMLTLADDSGLEVDALGGKPGVHSARYSGEGATDSANMAALTTALAPELRGPHDDGSGRFAARFRCVLALVDPLARPSAPVLIEGVCEGSVGLDARGSDGFGYDPLFVPRGGTRTLAELAAEEKNALSHRGKAMARMRLVLEKVLVARDERVRRLLAADC